MNTPIRVLCVDDHDFLIDGLEARLAVEDDIEFVGRQSTADRLVEAVKRTRPDIVILDIEMPGIDSFDAADDLRRHHPEARVVMLSAYVRDHYIDAAYAVGAWGYLSKSDPSSAIVDGIRSVARGAVAFSPRVKERSRSDGERMQARSKLSALTDRERQILRMIARGMTRAMIAEAISRSPMTVDNHRKSIMRKLGFSDRVELARYAIAEGLVEV